MASPGAAAGAGDSDLARIPAALARRGVEFVVIGGWAVERQQFELGYASQDVDLTPARDPENLNRLSEALDDLGAQVRAGNESFPFAHDAESLARASVLNLRCDAGGYHELAQDAHTVLIEVDGEQLPVRCADLAAIVRSKAAANRPKDRQVLALLVAQLEDREAHRRRGRNQRRGDDRGLGL